MPSFWFSNGINSPHGTLYQGDCVPGDRAATDAEVAAWQTANTPVPTLTFLQFMALFTPAQQAAVMTARRTDVQVDLFVTMAAGSGGLQLNNPEVESGINYLVSINVIPSSEGTRILAGTPPT